MSLIRGENAVYKGSRKCTCLKAGWVRRAERLEKSEEEGQSGRRWEAVLGSCRVFSFGWSQDFGFHSEWDAIGGGG